MVVILQNSGATTGVDILRKISLLQNDPDPNKRAIVAGVAPKVIMISNSPVGTAFWKQTCPDKNNKERKNPTIERELNHHKPTSLLEDALAPVYALLNTRDARGVYAQRAIGYVNNGFSAESKETSVFLFARPNDSAAASRLDVIQPRSRRDATGAVWSKSYGQQPRANHRLLRPKSDLEHRRARPDSRRAPGKVDCQ